VFVQGYWVKCKTKKKINGEWEECPKKLFVNINAKGKIEIKCPQCRKIQIINLEG